MDQGHKILFWFRESLVLDDYCSLFTAVHNSSEITPVYCFDPREEILLSGPRFQNGYLKEQIDSAACLRNELQNRGSNLLVVRQPYETIIPSLARVLNVSKVITNQLTEPDKTAIPELTAFRNQKAREVSRLLHSHSIPIMFEGPEAFHMALPASFPRFPEINPGVLPPSR